MTPMSLMAGFDIVIEISNETLLKLMKNRLQVDGATASPPFELSVPISGGSVHLIVKDMTLTLNSDDSITLTLSFDRASVQLAAPPLTVCQLDGSISISTPPLTLDSSLNVLVNLGAPTVAVNWSAAAEQEINKALPSSLPGNTFTKTAVQALTGYLQKNFPNPFPIQTGLTLASSGSNGSFTTTTISVVRLEVHCIANADPGKQALGLFGILLTANTASGNHNLKTGTAITAAHDGVCISISSAAFHTFVFCPMIAAKVGTTAASLPGSCGTGGSFSMQGVQIDHLSESFANGHIDINGSMSKSGTCYDIDGTLHGTLKLSISGSKITPILTMDEPDMHVHVPFLCEFAATFLGIGATVTGAIIDVLGDSIAEYIANNLVQKFLGGGLPGINVANLPGAVLSSIAISKEGLTFQATIPQFVFHPFAFPSISLNGSVITVSQSLLNSGIWHTKVPCLDQAKDYPWAEYAQTQTGSYNLVGKMVSQPFTPHFSILIEGVEIPLTGNSGAIEAPNVTTYYPMQVGTSGQSIQQAVHIGYSISGTNIQLTNQPAEGNYGFKLLVKATDCKGHPLQDDMQDELTANADVQFYGDYLDIKGYAQDVQSCLQYFFQLKYKTEMKMPVWPPINYPSPESIIEYVRDVVALGPQADEILLASKIAHGNSFYRAILSPAARQPRLLKTASHLAAGQQQLTSIAHELTNLTSSLLKTGSSEASRPVADFEIKKK